MKRFLLTLTGLMVSITGAFAGDNMWYYVSAKAYPSGEGKVYVSHTSNDVPARREYQDVSETKYRGGEDDGFFIFEAKPTEGKKFVGWVTVNTDMDGKEIISDIITNENPHTFEVEAKTDTGDDDVPDGVDYYPLIPDTTFAALFGLVDYHLAEDQNCYNSFVDIKLTNPTAEIGEKIIFSATSQDPHIYLKNWTDSKSNIFFDNPLTINVDGPNTLIPHFDIDGVKGTCGDNLTYTISSGHMEIEGEGDMWSFTESNEQPWGKYREFITSIAINEGVTSIGDDAFYNCSSLTSITIPESVTSIGSEAFQGCSSLVSITIPGSVKNIGWAAFSNCSSLSSINILEGVTSIGDDAFYNCSSLASITIPSSVTSIGRSAFSGTGWYDNQPDGLVYAGLVAYEYKGTMPANTSIVLKDGTIGIASGAFYGRSSLTSITIPEGVTSIGNDAFYRCSSLTSITIPSSVTSIGSSAFRYCSSLTSITIPSSVTSIEDYTFYGCSLTSVNIPEGVTSIGDYAFGGCSLTSVTIPESVTSIGSYAFSGCYCIRANVQNNTSFNLEDYGLTIVDEVYSGSCGTNLTYTLDTETGVLKIEGTGLMSDYSSSAYTSAPWYSNRSYVKEVQITQGVTSIGSYAFYECSSLTSITIPESVTSIGSYAFYNCSSLTSVNIPSSMKSIRRGAFCGCININDVHCPDIETLFDIEYEFDYRSDGDLGIVSSANPLAFAKHLYVAEEEVVDLVIPQNITSIPDASFYGCSFLTSVRIPETVSNIGVSAFYNCGLKRIEFQASVPNVKAAAFASCTDIEKVSFADMDALVNTNFAFDPIPYHFDDMIDENQYCSGNPLSYTQHLYISDMQITDLVIPDNIQRIPSALFYGCSCINSLKLPRSLTDIGEYAFYNCENLKDIVFLANTLNIGSCAFTNCNNLKTVSLPNLESLFNVHCGRDPQIVSGASQDYGVFTYSGNPISKAEHLLVGGSEISDITIPNLVTSIPAGLFEGCSNLTSIKLPDNDIQVGSCAFANCPNLKSFEFSDNSVSFSNWAFSGSWIGRVVLPNTDMLFKLHYDYIIRFIWSEYDFSCSPLSHLYVDNKEVESITIPDNIENIGPLTFYGCRYIRSIKIPESVKSIGDYAFSSCSSLTDVVCLAITPPTCSTPFTTYGTLHVLPGCGDAYRAADVWKDFTIVEDVVIPDMRDQVVASNTADATLTFTNTGTYEWAWDASGQRLMSTNKGVNSSTSQTTITINTSKPADFSFDYAVSSESGYDKLTITLDGATLVNAISGTSSSSKTQRLAAGTHTMVVKYVKDGSQYSNDDRAYVSNFRLEKVYNNYKLTFMVDGEQYHHITVEEGSSITLPDPPTKDGYTFKGWEGLPEDMLMPSSDLTVTAIFEENVQEDTDLATLTDAVYTTSLEAKIGTQLVLPILMKNSIEAIGFQADLVLPDGVTVAEDEDGLLMVELSTQRTTATKTNMFDYSYQADGSLRIVCNSTKGIAFTGNDGEVALVTLNISEEIEEGDYPIIIKNIVITDAQGIDKKKVDLVKSTLTLFDYILGDVNGDNEIDVADLSAISSYILGHPSESFVEMAADVNKDNEIDVADISALAYLILHPETAQKAKARKVAEKKENIENAYNTLYAEMLQVEAGTDVVLPIMMRNSIEATGFQLDLMLPEGVTLKDAALSNARTSSKRTNLFDYAHQADGSYRILCNSTKGLSFNGHDGEVMILTLHIDKDAELGAQTIALKDMVLTDATGMLREESSLSESTLWIGNATGIHEMASEKSAPAYDLQGRQVSKKQKGIHIQNGKKTVVK